MPTIHPRCGHSWMQKSGVTWGDTNWGYCHLYMKCVEIIFSQSCICLLTFFPFFLMSLLLFFCLYSFVLFPICLAKSLTALVYSYFIYLFIYFWLCWVFGSCEGPLQLRQVGATPHRGAGTAPHRGARALHHRSPSRCGAQAPDAQAQQLWLTGPAAPWHVGSSQTRARTRVPCISRQTLNHCATREALTALVYKYSY